VNSLFVPQVSYILASFALCSAVPYAAEAMAGLISLGMTSPEVVLLCKANTQLSADDDSILFDGDGLVAVPLEV